MKKNVLTVLITAAMSILLFGGNRAPVSTPSVVAQVTSSRADFVTNLRTADNNLITASESILQLNHQYVANGWGSGSFTGSDLPAGITGSDVATALGNLVTLATAITGNGSASISSGTSTTIYKIK